MDIEDSFVALSFLLSAMLKNYKKKHLGEQYLKLTISQFFYLRAIEYLGQPTFTELAAAMRVSKPTVTIAVTKLVELGFVSKVISSIDRRVSNIRLTKTGQKLARSEHEAYRDYLRKLAACLTDPEKANLESIMGKATKTAFKCAGLKADDNKSMWLQSLD